MIKKIDVKAVKAKAKTGKDWLIMLKVKPLEGNEDVVGTKVLKCFEHIENNLKKDDFKIIESGWEFEPDKSLLYYIVKKEKLSDKVTLYGPPVREKNDATRFRLKHKKIIVKNNRLYAEEKRKYKIPENLIKELIKQAYVKERVKTAKIIN